MSDPTEQARRDLMEQMPAVEGQTWTTEELTRDFEVQGFLAPFVIVRRKSDGKVGSLLFRTRPERVYYGWSPDGGEDNA